MGWYLWIKTKPPKNKFGQWISAVVVSFCYFTSGMAMAWTSPAFAKIRDKKVGFTLNQYEMSMIAAIPFAGRIFAPLTMCYLIDVIGRKACLCIGSALSIIHWLMICISYNRWIMITARLLNGWHSGTTFYIIPIYIGEITHKKTRGRAQGILNAQFLLGILFENTIGSFVSYDNLSIVSGSIDMFLMMFMLLVPDSPYYYLKKGQFKEGEITLQWLRGRDKDIKKELTKIDNNMKVQLANKSKYADIFKVKSNRKAIKIVLFMMVIQRFSGMSAIISYAAFIVPDPWWLPNEKGPIPVTATYFVMCIVSGILVDQWGRKNFLLLSSSGSFVFMTGCTVWFYFEKYKTYDVTNTEWLVIVFLMLMAGFYSMGFFYIPPLVMSELFPMNIKAKANAIGVMTAISVSAFVVFMFLPLTNAYGLHANFLIYSISTFAGIIFSTLMIETKGKSLEGIQAMLEGRPYTSEATVFEQARDDDEDI